MDVSESKLIPPDEFPFPFNAYSIQKDLMRKLYLALEEKKLGIFESPTGTGKSMSLICGSLKWLVDAEKRRKEDLVEEIKKLEKEIKNVSKSDNWLEEHGLQIKARQKKDVLQDFLTKIMDKDVKIASIRQRAKNVNDMLKFRKTEEIANKDNKKTDSNHSVSCDDIFDDDVLLEEVTIEEQENQCSDSETEAETEEYNNPKIYLCSRTHSQLSQLVREIQRSPYKDLNIRVVSLASRQNYCINDNVLKLKNLSLMNEVCQDLHHNRKGKTTKVSTEGEVMKRQKTSSGCPFYRQSSIDQLKAVSLTEIHEVEEMIQLGKTFKGCPYYASRLAVEDAQVVVLPYNTILHKSTRQACNINLKDSVVIIDEAHNLLDTIGNIHNCVINGHQLACSHSQLVQYRDKYREKFSPYNLLYLNQLIFIINKLLMRLGGKGGIHPNTASPNANHATLETLSQFILACEIDTINLYRILEFSTKSKVVHKLKGFVEKYRPSVMVHKKKEEEGVSAFLKTISKKGVNVIQEVPEEKVMEEEPTSSNPLIPVLSFIEALTNHCLDGRVVISQNTTLGNSNLKFLLLNPASHFTDIVKEARSVILAGGTMQPISEFTEQLFYLSGGNPERISLFSCGHVIPPSNILPIILASGPSGKTFDFSYQHRNECTLLDELGRLLVNVCSIIPAGVVCFLPSYEYEAAVFKHFQNTRIDQKLQLKKKILREPKKSSQVDEVLRNYSKAIEESGAILFSVVGGKLSEGLNFSDDLGRCVVVVGLPYPNFTSPELKEKMNYLNANVGPAAGRIYYENLCMKAVNQSIGRSVRHKDDYAAVLLVDHRYSRAQCRNALPEWIQKSLKVEEKFGPTMGLLAKFFASKKANTKS